MLTNGLVRERRDSESAPSIVGSVAAVSGFVGGYYNQMAPEIGGGNPTVTVFALKP